jgi:hypothetical protein
MSAVTVLATGALLWYLVHSGSFGTTGQILAVGVFCAFVAAGVQGMSGEPALPKLLAGRGSCAVMGWLSGGAQPLPPGDSVFVLGRGECDLAHCGFCLLFPVVGFVSGMDEFLAHFVETLFEV